MLALLLLTIFPALAISIGTFENPLLATGPDPWVLKVNNTYYHTHTMWDKIVLYKTGEMSELGQVAPVTVWLPPSTGPYSKDIWAPEIHYYDGKFYMYFTADDGHNINHRIYVLENANQDATIGKVYDPNNDHWAIDCSTFEFKGQRYLIWSGIANDTIDDQNIYIAKLSNPWSIEGSRVRISTPTYDWEKLGSPPNVNEGPEALISPSGNLFLTFSAAGCWTDNYSLGLLSLAENGDPMNANDWTKHANPVFVMNSTNGAFGPGHNGFFKSLDESEFWLIYHANNHTGQGCGSRRNPRIQKFTWNSDGTPNFGSPLPIGVPITKPSGEM